MITQYYSEQCRMVFLSKLSLNTGKTRMCCSLRQRIFPISITRHTIYAKTNLWPWFLIHDLENLINSEHHLYQRVLQIWKQFIKCLLRYHADTICTLSRDIICVSYILVCFLFENYMLFLHMSPWLTEVCSVFMIYPDQGSGVTKAPFINFSITGNFDFAKV